MGSKFNALLVEAIDEVLASLGEPVKNTLYIRLEEYFSMHKTEIPENINDFSQFLYRTLGPAACLVQIKIMKSFNAKLAKEVSNNFQPITLLDNFSFASYINEMSKNYQTMPQ